MWTHRLTRMILFSMVLTTFANRALADEANFAWLSFAPEIGYAHFFEGDPKLDGFADVNFDKRNGFVIKGHIDLGGDGLAVELAPVFAWESSDGGPLGDFSVLGGEITLVYRFGKNNVYPSIGAGFHGANIFPNEFIDAGCQLYARIPFGLTWYFLKYLGLVVEAGVMYGGTGIRAKSPSEFSDPATVNAATALSDMEFAPGFALDILVGLRFP